MGFSSSANSLQRENDIKLSTSPYVQNFIQGFKMSALLSIWFKSLVCFSEATSLSFLTCQLRVRVHVFLDQFHPWLTICVCLCKGIIQQEWCKLTNCEHRSFFIVPWRWRERMQAFHKEWESHFKTLLLFAGLRCQLLAIFQGQGPTLQLGLAYLARKFNSQNPVCEFWGQAWWYASSLRPVRDPVF